MDRVHELRVSPLRAPEPTRAGHPRASETPDGVFPGFDPATLGAPAPVGASVRVATRRSPLRTSAWVIAAGLASALLLALLAAIVRTPGSALVLAILAILGATGVFFLFATSVGLVRFGLPERQDMVEALLSSSPVGQLVVGSDGAVLQRNATIERLQHEADVALPGGAIIRDGTGLIEHLFELGDRDSARQDVVGEGGFFRLMRAARLGRSAEDVVTIAPERHATLAGRYRIAVGVLADTDGVERATEWRITSLEADETAGTDSRDALARDVASFESLPVGVVVASQEGRVLSANARMRSWSGLTPELLEREALTVADILPDCDFDQHNGSEFCNYRAPDGASFSTRISIASRSGVAGRMVLTVEPQEISSQPPVVAFDEEQGSALFNAAPIAIAVVDAAGIIANANDAFARMFGDDSINLIDQLHPESRDQVLFALNAAVDGDLHPSPVEIEVGDDRAIKGRVFISPAQADDTSDDAGSVRAIVYAIDLTKQRELETQMAQSQKMQAVGQLAGGMAHDFNNLLTIITLSSDFLLSSHQKSDPAFKDIMQIKQVAGRAAEIVKQLLAFSRQQTLLPEVLSLTDEISDWTTTLRPLLGERVSFETNNGRDLWMVKADKSQLGQVIVNLAVNARDAIPEDGNVTLRTRNITARDVARLDEKEIVPGDYVLCEVSDTGAGMSDAVREKIFDPFFSTKDVGKGTGLGLSTVYGIIKQTGGYIFCDSTPGRGTTFRIYLPRHDEDVPPVASTTSVANTKADVKPTATDMTGVGTVLLVEDEEPVRRLAARALSRQGFEVLEAGSGVEALDVLDEAGARVDLVVSDIVMPEMDGPTLLKSLRQTRPEMKVIFISGYAEDALATLAPDETFAF
ncbi:MAG: ATP-binding protein, partial [Pseudomonadota bacterium]